jgi:glycine/D-amino acid oxidase-like deaminating enzyme
MIPKQSESMSLWMDTIEMPHCPSLAENKHVDVCIVGAGIGGMTSAYLLMKEGKTVCVLEDYEIGSGQTGRTTAHFSTALDDRYSELEVSCLKSSCSHF